uniref:Uncharacterized protein n=1 Tax=Urocitellus parryii TaxID=9999 RepID=A0A8D2KC56_UROPR
MKRSPYTTHRHSTAPFLPPWPSHLSQITFFCRISFFIAPFYKSSNTTENFAFTSPLQIQFPLILCYI